MATAGKGGDVKIGGTTVAEIQEWSIDENVDLMEKAVFGDDHQSHTVGLRDTSGSFSGLFAATQIANTAPGATLDKIRLEISTGVYVEAEAKVSSRSINTVVDGQAEIDIDFEFQEEGAWTTS